MLYGTSVIISIRNIFRHQQMARLVQAPSQVGVEFIAGHDSYLFLNEWPVYVFDGALMLLVMISFYIWYPFQLQNEEIGTESMIELTNEDKSPPGDEPSRK